MGDVGDPGRRLARAQPDQAVALRRVDGAAGGPWAAPARRRWPRARARSGRRTRTASRGTGTRGRPRSAGRARAAPPGAGSGPERRRRRRRDPARRRSARRAASRAPPGGPGRRCGPPRTSSRAAPGSRRTTPSPRAKITRPPRWSDRLTNRAEPRRRTAAPAHSPDAAGGPRRHPHPRPARRRRPRRDHGSRPGHRGRRRGGRGRRRDPGHPGSHRGVGALSGRGSARWAGHDRHAGLRQCPPAPHRRPADPLLHTRRPAPRRGHLLVGRARPRPPHRRRRRAARPRWPASRRSATASRR